MTNKRYTDEEIKSSLEVISTTQNCNECKIRNCKWGTCNCSQITANVALDLIDRQRAEIERSGKRKDNGKWVKIYNNPNDGNYYCTECHHSIDIATGRETPIDRQFFYCPYCGCKMEDMEGEE